MEQAFSHTPHDLVSHNESEKTALQLIAYFRAELLKYAEHASETLPTTFLTAAEVSAATACARDILIKDLSIEAAKQEMSALASTLETQRVTAALSQFEIVRVVSGIEVKVSLAPESVAPLQITLSKTIYADRPAESEVVDEREISLGILWHTDGFGIPHPTTADQDYLLKKVGLHDITAGELPAQAARRLLSILNTMHHTDEQDSPAVCRAKPETLLSTSERTTNAATQLRAALTDELWQDLRVNYPQLHDELVTLSLRLQHSTKTHLNELQALPAEYAYTTEFKRNRIAFLTLVSTVHVLIDIYGGYEALQLPEELQTLLYAVVMTIILIDYENSQRKAQQATELIKAQLAMYYQLLHENDSSSGEKVSDDDDWDSPLRLDEQ